MFDLTGLFLILSPTTGQDHIDKRYFTDKKVKIFTLKNKKNFLKKINASSEFTLMLILMSLRKIKSQIKKVESSYLIGNEVADKKIGIIGLGRNGLKISKILKKLDGEIFFLIKLKKKIGSQNF